MEKLKWLPQIIKHMSPCNSANLHGELRKKHYFVPPVEGYIITLTDGQQIWMEAVYVNEQTQRTKTHST